MDEFSRPSADDKGELPEEYVLVKECANLPEDLSMPGKKLPDDEEAYVRGKKHRSTFAKLLISVIAAMIAVPSFITSVLYSTQQELIERLYEVEWMNEYLVSAYSDISDENYEDLCAVSDKIADGIIAQYKKGKLTLSYNAYLSAEKETMGSMTASIIGDTTNILMLHYTAGKSGDSYSFTLLFVTPGGTRVCYTTRSGEKGGTIEVLTGCTSSRLISGDAHYRIANYGEDGTLTDEFDGDVTLQNNNAVSADTGTTYSLSNLVF